GLLSRSHSEYVEGETLIDMIREDLVAERVAIDSYNEMIRYVGDDDVTTRRMLETILAVEEEHANDLVSFLADMDKDWKTRERRAAAEERLARRLELRRGRRGRLHRHARGAAVHDRPPLAASRLARSRAAHSPRPRCHADDGELREPRPLQGGGDVVHRRRRR